MAEGGEQVEMIGLNGLAETRLPKVNQYLVVDMLCSNNISAALLLHTVEKCVKLSLLSLLV